MSLSQQLIEQLAKQKTAWLKDYEKSTQSEKQRNTTSKNCHLRNLLTTGKNL